MLRLSVAQTNRVCFFIESATDEVKASEGKLKREMFEQPSSLEARGGVSMEIEYDPMIFVVRLIEGELYFFVLMKN